MNRRETIALLGGATAWPLAARAQQPDRVRRIGVLMPGDETDPVRKTYVSAFTQALQELGWIIGRNLQIDYRWGARDYIRDGVALAADLIALRPDVVLTDNGNLLADLQQATPTIPIVFAGVIDAVGAGRVESLPRPSANATGFTALDFGMSGKWLELLKQIAPQVSRVLVLRGQGPGQFGQLGALQGAAPLFGVELRPFELRSGD